MTTERLPVAVIGAGPVGLAAAAHLVAKGERPVVLEAGDTAGASVLRWGHVRILFGGGAGDERAERGRLGQRMRALAEAGALRIFTGFRTKRLTTTAAGVVVASDDRELPPVDEVVAATGFRPDLSFLRDVRLDLDAVVESPARLAPLIDPNVHSA